MKVEVDIIGFRHLDFIDSDGNRIVGTQAFYLSPILSNGAGMLPCKKWIPESIDSHSLKVGKNIFDISLDGKVFNIF